MSSLTNVPRTSSVVGKGLELTVPLKRETRRTPDRDCHSGGGTRTDVPSTPVEDNIRLITIVDPTRQTVSSGDNVQSLTCKNHLPLCPLDDVRCETPTSELFGLVKVS